MKVLGLVFPVILLLNGVSARADGCTTPKTSYDRTYCMAKLFMEADKELNEVYKELSQAIKPEVKKTLVKAQRDWIKYRDNACESQGAIDVDCNYQVNKKRTETLRDRLRECKTGHCQDDLMSKEDWGSTSGT